MWFTAVRNLKHICHARAGSPLSAVDSVGAWDTGSVHPEHGLLPIPSQGGAGDVATMPSPVLEGSGEGEGEGTADAASVAAGEGQGGADVTPLVKPPGYEGYDLDPPKEEHPAAPESSLGPGSRPLSSHPPYDSRPHSGLPHGGSDEGSFLKKKRRSGPVSLLPAMNMRMDDNIYIVVSGSVLLTAVLRPEEPEWAAEEVSMAVQRQARIHSTASRHSNGGMGSRPASAATGAGSGSQGGLDHLKKWNNPLEPVLLEAVDMGGGSASGHSDCLRNSPWFCVCIWVHWRGASKHAGPSGPHNNSFPSPDLSPHSPHTSSPFAHSALQTHSVRSTPRGCQSCGL